MTEPTSKVAAATPVAARSTGGALHALSKIGFSKMIIGFTSGAIGQYAIFPMDTVKTRLQGSSVVYRNMIDCSQKMVRSEGVRALYKGVLPVAALTSPEKALKLGINDLFCWALKDNNGKLSLASEIFAGGMAGFGQVVLTNPMEIVKIRVQLDPTLSTWQITKDLGIRGLFRGSKATWLRDIPFSILYFPSYHYLKAIYPKNENGLVPAEGLLLTATSAGMFSSWLVTPADAIKTRLQTVDASTRSVPECFRQVVKQEGYRGLFRGGTARLAIRGPQFGITLLAYDMLSRIMIGPEQTAH
eukprot:gb/GECH01007983.1/.p1 GENE.gb/GECH01007983.1/~~gb/GECH01007983.1/.p1  ORF type:complete len:301 (+),score=66.05 gb/GECH01007983.1/:1-903(+)